MLYRLSGAGYKAYLVGGSVRDLLLQRTPKDFDIGTDAHPSALRRLFRNCRLIGRRFRLAHILFANGKVIEVATFRRRPEPADANAPELLMTSDNTFGTAREDALRRDFTINGLFYDIADFSVIDYVGGLEDLEAGLIRTIGDPDIRFREDPVRMLRAVEFASRLGFAITPDAYEAILDHRKEIVKSAPPRVTEELAQSLKGGHALTTFLLMRELGLLDALLPRARRGPARDRPGASPRDRAPLLGPARRARRRAAARPRLRRRGALRPLLPSDRPGARARGRPRRRALAGTALDADRGPRHATGDPHGAPHAVSHRIKQALTIVGKLSHRPDSRLATPRLAFREAFPTALELFELRAMATGRGEELVRDWRALAARVEKTRQALGGGNRAAASSPPAAPAARRPGRARGAGLGGLKSKV